MIRSFIRSIVSPLLTEGNRPTPPIVPPIFTEAPITYTLPALPIAQEAITVEDACRALRSEGRSIREIAKEMRLSYYMARKYVS
jgi:hypothetical protein